MTRTTVFILCDALRSEYLNRSEMSFLSKMSSRGYFARSVQQSFGFCERSEIISGLQGNKSGFITAVGASDNSPYRHLAWLCRLLSGLDAALSMPFLPKTVSKHGKLFLKKLFVKLTGFIGIQMKPYYIPYNYLSKLNYTEDSFDHTSQDAFGTPSIYDRVRQVGGSFSTESFTALGQRSPYVTDMDRLDGGLNWLRDTEGRADDRLLMVYVNLPDNAGHKFGPSSEEMNKSLGELDKLLENFTQSVEEVVNGETNFIVLGDHGMADVVKHVDIEKIVTECARNLKISLEHDVMYYLDSTVARFWALTADGRVLIDHLKDEFQFQQSGRWMTSDLAQKWDIVWPNPSYGDDMWVADTGALVFPDFFHRDQPYLGMHGYDPTLNVNQGLLVSWGDGVAAEDVPLIKLSQVHDILTKSILRGLK